jgi:mannose-6-phosphate isomerase-like protein (cupin superfamily)/pyrroloquinoline quinone (PQQ) biosynthesis protein C
MHKLACANNQLSQFSYLDQLVDNHPLWSNQLISNLEQGNYDQVQLSFLFHQHHHYSRNFTRLLMLAGSRLQRVGHRGTIVSNLYEESGCDNNNISHAQLMQNFLLSIRQYRPEERNGSLTDAQAVDYSVRPYTQLYVDRCTRFLAECSDLQAAAFLAWGTEGMVPRLYSCFVTALRALGMPEADFHYFTLHIECDDGHHDTLCRIVEDLCHEKLETQAQSWLDQSLITAVTTALDLREAYFTALARDLYELHLQTVLAEIRNCQTPAEREMNACVQNSVDTNRPVYHNRNPAENIDFHVTRSDLRPEVIDPRILVVPAGRQNESHRHAHESFFYVLSGKGRVHIGKESADIGPGAMVYVPRWIMHHTENTGAEEMKILAITDYGLTRRFIGNAESSYRRVAQNAAETA